MTEPCSYRLATFSASTKEIFLQQISDKPNKHHLNEIDQRLIIEWLTNPHKQPSSQKEYSRRNYVRKTFDWDEKTQNLFAIAKTNGGRNRLVITEEKMANVIEYVHESNSHAGWDTTWKDISDSYYGILRSDVILLLKTCQICAMNPCKRPKSSKGPGMSFDGHQPPTRLDNGNVT